MENTTERLIPQHCTFDLGSEPMTATRPLPPGLPASFSLLKLALVFAECRVTASIPTRRVFKFAINNPQKSVS